MIHDDQSYSTGLYWYVEVGHVGNCSDPDDAMFLIRLESWRKPSDMFSHFYQGPPLWFVGQSKEKHIKLVRTILLKALQMYQKAHELVYRKKSNILKFEPTCDIDRATSAHSSSVASFVTGCIGIRSTVP